MSNTETRDEALKLADEQEAALLAVMNGEMKIGKLPVEPFVKGCAELRRLSARVAELEAGLRDVLAVDESGKIDHLGANYEIRSWLGRARYAEVLSLVGVVEHVDGITGGRNAD